MSSKETAYILLIMNCEKYQKKRNVQCISWIKKIPDWLSYYHVIGKTLCNDTNYIFDHKEHILYVNTEDDYISLPKKVIAAYSACLKEYDQDLQYIFKTDDDQMLNNVRFFDIVKNLLINGIILTKKIHYGGHIVNVSTPYKSEYYRIHPELPSNMIIQKTRYCSGRFYFLSRDAIRWLIMKRNQICKEYLEDYAIGYYLDDGLFKTNMLSLKTEEYFQDYEPDPVDSIDLVDSIDSIDPIDPDSESNSDK